MCRFTILNRGTLRNGKDSFFEPMMKIFGSAAGAANVEDVASGWGDYVFGMKFMIMHEANMGQRKDTANNLKIIIAPSANGVRMLNIKGKGLVTQADVTAYLIMTNHRDAIVIESGGILLRIHGFRHNQRRIMPDYGVGWRMNRALPR